MKTVLKKGRLFGATIRRPGLMVFTALMLPGRNNGAAILCFKTNGNDNHSSASWALVRGSTEIFRAGKA